MNGCPESMRLLLDANAIVDILNHPQHELATDSSPLHIAASRGDYECVRLLVDAFANLEVYDSSQNPALVWACRNGHLDIVRLLIDSGASVNRGLSPEPTHPPFLPVSALYAVMDGPNEQVDVVKTLLEAGADVNWRGADPNVINYNDPDPITAIHQAVSNRRPEVLKLLLEFGADMDDIDDPFGSTPVIKAASRGDYECVRVLVDAGADLEHTDFTANPALVWACRNGHLDIVRFLIDRGATIDGPNEYLDVIKHVLEAGADVNWVHSNFVGDTPLHVALRKQHPDTALLLINAGAEVFLPCDVGFSPLQLFPVFVPWSAEWEQVLERMVERGEMEGFDNWGRMGWQGLFADASRLKNSVMLKCLLRLCCNDRTVCDDSSGVWDEEYAGLYA
ncbi:hypothetical protein HDU96_007392 [Phlyctochytrium bullatum]|nr:hypothetical protein HDU96_007392 [Phlyctochytrium bullatum]